MTPRVFVRRAKNRSGARTHQGGQHYWNVYDCTGPKVFIRQLTYAYFEAAIKNATLLAREKRINTHGLFGVQRIEYGDPQDPTRSKR